MKVKIDSMIRLQDVPQDLLSAIKKDLTIKNPDYVKKKAMGLNRWAWGDEWIKLFKEQVVEGVKEIIVPRGYLDELSRYDAGVWDFYNHRVRRPFVEYPQKPKLRDYQQPFVEYARSGLGQGVFIAPCGSGKTASAMGIAYALQQPVLWITHTMDLLKQSMESAEKFLGLTGQMVGVIQGDNMSVGSHMTFATVQTLAKRDLSEISKYFGCVIVDECHLVFKDDKNTRMFESVISQIPAFYRFGLTASEFRADGLIETMFTVIGPKLYEIDQDDPRLLTLKPKVEYIPTEFCYEQPVDDYGDKKMLNVQLLLKAMKEDGRRNALLKSTLYNKISCDDYCLVLGDSLDHLMELQDFVMRQGRLAAFVCGNTPKKEREKIMEDMRSGKYHYLFATYQLAKLGLDMPILNKLVLATPKKDKTSIQQAVGRVMRPEEGKAQPIVYDLWDINVPQLKYWGHDRAKVYKALGCNVEGGPKTRGR